jgi:urease accessory protein
MHDLSIRSTLKAGAVLPAGTWDATPSDTVLIDFDRRHRRRIQMTTEGGVPLLRDGDGLLLEGGAVVLVKARAEPLLDIHAHDAAGLVRIAWHLGNRHLLVQLVGSHIRIREDHVIADMVRGLGGHVQHIEAPFDPEAGAYAGGHQHHHDDDDDHHGH